MNITHKLLVLTAALALAACQTTPPSNTDLAEATAAVERARNNPYVARSGALELERAQQSLRRAEADWADRRNLESTSHLAYLATQRAEIAMAMGAQAQADERLQQAGPERERMRLEARTREAERATQAAHSSQQTARNAQSDAQLARGQADAARAQAEAARQQADSASQQAALQGERAAALERDLQALRGRSTERGMVVTLGDVLFDTGRATLQAGAQRSVEQLAAVLGQYPERRVLIEGFTDSVGSDEMNMDLSRRRAEAFRLALANNGVSAERMEVRAHGEANPVADNSSAAGRQQNRRVEILFSDGEGRFAAR